MEATIASIDEQREGRPQAALPSRFSFEFAEAGFGMLVIPVLQAVKQLSSGIQESGTALRTRQWAGHWWPPAVKLEAEPCRPEDTEAPHHSQASNPYRTDDSALYPSGKFSVPDVSERWKLCPEGSREQPSHHWDICQIAHNSIARGTRHNDSLVGSPRTQFFSQQCFTDARISCLSYSSSAPNYLFFLPLALSSYQGPASDVWRRNDCG